MPLLLFYLFIFYMYTSLMCFVFVEKFVSASQPLNAFAFIVDGLHYGVSDFPYAAYSMVCFF